MQEVFYDPETASSSGATHVPSQPSTIPSPRTMPCRDSGLPHDTRNICGYFRKPFWTTTCSSTIQRIWQPLLANWDLTLLEVQSDPRVKWHENRKIRPYLYHASKVEVLCWIILVELILTVVWLIIRDSRFRKCIWENLLTLWNFRAGKSTSKLKYVLNQQILISLYEVEIAKSIDHLLTSQSTVGRRDFPDYEILDAKIASALKKILTSVHFRRRVSVEDQRAWKNDRFFQGRQIAYMIYEYFGHQSLWSGTGTVRSGQKTLTEWWRSRFRHKMGQSSVSSKWNACGNGPGRLKQVKNTGFCSASHCIGFVWTRERRHIDQTMRTRSVRARSEIV